MGPRGDAGSGVVVVHLSGNQDFGSRDALRTKLKSLREANIAVMDLSGVAYADSTFMNAVASLYKHYRGRGRPFAIRLVAVSPQLRRLFALTQLDRFVEFWDALEDAKSSGIVTKP